MNTRKFVAILAMTLIMVDSFAATLQEIGDLQTENDKAELVASLEKKKNGGQQAPIQAVVQQAPIKVIQDHGNLKITGIMAIGDVTRAIVNINGVEVVMSEGESQLGYFAKRIEDRSVKLVKLNNKGKAEGKEILLYLVGSSDMQSIGPGANMQLPPVPQGTPRAMQDPASYGAMVR